jgi:hypothetical protein
VIWSLYDLRIADAVGSRGSDSKVRYITSLKRGDMGIRGKIH